MKYKIGDILQSKENNGRIEIVDLIPSRNSYKIEHIGYYKQESVYSEDLISAYYFFKSNKNNQIEKKCECGKEKHNFFNHMFYCPKYQKNL